MPYCFLQFRFFEIWVSTFRFFNEVKKTCPKSMFFKVAHVKNRCFLTPKNLKYRYFLSKTYKFSTKGPAVFFELQNSLDKDQLFLCIFLLRKFSKIFHFWKMTKNKTAPFLNSFFFQFFDFWFSIFRFFFYEVWNF